MNTSLCPERFGEPSRADAFELFVRVPASDRGPVAVVRWRLGLGVLDEARS